MSIYTGLLQYVGTYRPVFVHHVPGTSIYALFYELYSAAVVITSIYQR